MIKGILIDTSSYFKLSCCFNNLADFILKIKGEDYKIYLSGDLIDELECNTNKFQSKFKSFEVPTINKSNKFNCSSKKKKEICDKLILVEYESSFHEFDPPLSIIDMKLIASQLVFPDDIIILSDDKNLINLSKCLKCVAMKTPQFIAMCIEQNIILLEDLKTCRDLLTSINEYPYDCDSVLKKHQIYI